MSLNGGSPLIDQPVGIADEQCCFTRSETIGPDEHAVREAPARHNTVSISAPFVLPIKISRKASP